MQQNQEEPFQPLTRLPGRAEDAHKPLTKMLLEVALRLQCQNGIHITLTDKDSLKALVPSIQQSLWKVQALLDEITMVLSGM